MSRLLWICLGGAVGTGARYLLSGWMAAVFGASFPYGTLTVNVAGSFLIAMVMHAGLTTEIIPPALRITLATGVLGGFTTFSTFSYETLRAFQEGDWLAGVANIALTVGGCLLACLLGFQAARWLLGS